MIESKLALREVKHSLYLFLYHTAVKYSDLISQKVLINKSEGKLDQQRLKSFPKSQEPHFHKYEGPSQPSQKSTYS